VIRAPANMPAAPQPFDPAGLGPDSNQQGDVDTQSTINPLASSDVGGTAGHDAAACACARGKCDGERVCYARDANCVLPPTTQSLSARQVVAPQAQNCGTGAAAIALIPQPSTIENADAAASKVSTSQRSVRFLVAPPVDDDEGWTKCLGKTARGRAKQSAECGTSVPSIRSAVRPSIRSAVRPSTRSSVRPSAGVVSPDAVAPPVTPSVPFAAVPLPPWEGLCYKNGTLVPPSVRAVPSAVAPSVNPSVAVPAPPGSVTPGNAASPVVYSGSPATIPQTASTNDSPIPAGAAAASTNEPTSKTNGTKRISSVKNAPISNINPPVQASACGTSPSPSPFDLPVKSGIKLNAAAGTKARPANNTIFTGDTSSDPVLSATKVKGSKKRQREKKKKNLTTDDGIISPPVLPPITYVIYDAPNVFTAKDNRAYHRDQELKNSKYSHYVHTFAVGPEAAPTQAVSEPPTPKPLAPRRITPQTPRMSRLAKKAAKFARNTPKAVSIKPTSLPKIVEADQAPTAGIPPVPDLLKPAIWPQVVETGDVRGAAMPPVTPEPTLSLEAVPPAPVLLTGAQITAANTTRKRSLNTARLSRYRRGLDSPELPISKAMELNLAAGTSITATTTSSRHRRLLERNLAAISYATGKLSTLKATQDARVLAIRVSVARRVSQTAPSVLRDSAVRELNSHLLFISKDRPAPFSSERLLHHLSRAAPSSLNLGKPSLSAKKPSRKRMQTPYPIFLSRAAKRHVKAAAINLNYLLKEQGRLTATKDGPFMVPGSPPPVLAVPFVPPSWAAITTGGYRHHRIRRKIHKPHHRPFRKETGRERRTNRRKATRSCAGPEPGPRANRRKAARSCAGPNPGPGRRPCSAGAPHATPSHSSYTPSRPYRPNGGYRHREGDDDGRDRPPPPPPPPNPPRGNFPSRRIRCHFSDHAGQCEHHCRPDHNGNFPFRIVRKHITLTFCSDECMGAFLVDEQDTLISQPGGVSPLRRFVDLDQTTQL